jgi:thiazole synthase
MEGFTVGEFTFRSRLVVGSGKYPSLPIQREAVAASGADLVTVALRRVDPKAPPESNVLAHLPEGTTILPNTAGCYTVADAVTTAQLGRELFGHGLVKLEVIGDERTLFLAEIGCAAVMPLAAPIGSGLGIRNPANLRIILETVEVPVIVDAGVGTASDATVAMELGCVGVLMNTAIAGAKDPVKMARAMKLGVEAGRLAYEAGRIARRLYANASSPLDGLATF